MGNCSTYIEPYKESNTELHESPICQITRLNVMSRQASSANIPNIVRSPSCKHSNSQKVVSHPKDPIHNISYDKHSNANSPKINNIDNPFLKTRDNIPCNRYSNTNSPKIACPRTNNKLQKIHKHSTSDITHNIWITNKLYVSGVDHTCIQPGFVENKYNIPSYAISDKTHTNITENLKSQKVSRLLMSRNKSPKRLSMRVIKNSI